MARVAMLFLLVALGCGSRYRVNEVATNVPNVFLHEVRRGGDETEIVFRLEVDTACEVGVSAPGAPAAFRLRAGERTFALTEVSGIEEAPATTSIEAQRSLRFTLGFEALPADVQAFDVEGEVKGVGPVAFAVRMDTPNVVKRGW